MQQQNMLLAFLQELLQRLFTKSPKFFKIFQLVFGTATTLTGLPDFLKLFSIQLPASLCMLENKFIAALSLGIFIASKLTTQSQIVAGKEGEPPLKQTNGDKLPFTAATEIKNTTKELASK